MTRSLRLVAATALAAAAGCNPVTEPGLIGPAYALVAVDGRPLPVPVGTDGTVLVARHLQFAHSFDEWEGQQGVVRMVSSFRPAQGPEYQTDTNHDWQYRDGLLSINLCPQGSACIAIVPFTLEGVVHRGDLILIERIAGSPGPEYRYVPRIPID